MVTWTSVFVRTVIVPPPAPVTTVAARPLTALRDRGIGDRSDTIIFAYPVASKATSFTELPGRRPVGGSCCRRACWVMSTDR
jgi:hypothetical protein